MLFSTSIQIALILAQLANAVALPRSATLPLPSKTIFQFNESAWIESIAARSNGELLLSRVRVPELWILDPSSPFSEAQLLHSFPGVNSLLGLTEFSPDVFAVIAGNITAENEPVPESFSIWTIDFTSDSSPSFAKAAVLPDAGLLDGLTALPGVPDTVLAADATKGAVWKINTQTGESSIVIQVSEMMPPLPPAFFLGINGLHVRDGYLYFTNSGLIIFARVQIDFDGTVVAGAQVETLYVGDTLLDDFAFENQTGTAFINTDTGNTLVAVGQDEKSETVVGSIGSLTIAGGTSAIFGRGKNDFGILYVATSGAILAPVNGTITENGKVVAIDTNGFLI
jgi:hypothetical protein